MARPRSDIAPRLVQAAAERFLREGVDGASLRAIARDADTNIGMVYYYFPTKDDLFLAVVEDVYAGLLADLEVALAPDRPPLDRLRALCGRFAKMSDAELRVVRIIIREALVSSQRLTRLVERFSRGHVPLVVRTVLDAIAQGSLRRSAPLPGMILCIATLAAMPQLVRRVVEQEAPQLAAFLPAPDALADLAFDVMLHGLAPPAK